jgi:phospholipase/carboxylesterase
MAISVERQEFGGLSTLVLQDSQLATPNPRRILLCHGFGAPGDDLADIGTFLLQQNPKVASTCCFIFPAAPIDLTAAGMPGGRAWWPINMAQLAAMHETRDFEPLTAISPPGMNEATDQLHLAMQQMQQRWNCSAGSFHIGGFSQGAMIATNLTLTRQLKIAQLCILSGTLLNSDAWRQLAKSHSGLNVLMSHGSQDQILPIDAAQLLRDMLLETGHAVNYLEFQGPHTIPLEILTRLEHSILQSHTEADGIKAD